MPASATRLVVLPGLDGFSRLARSFLHQLPPSVAPLPLDFPADAYLDRHRLDLARDRLRGASGFVLGQSYSAALAQELAADLDARGLILVTPPSQRRLRRSFAVGLRRLPLWLLRFRPPRLAVRWLLLGWDAPGSLLDDFQASVQAVAGDVLARRLRELGESAAAPLPPTCPTLCLHAAQDRLLTGPCPTAADAPVRHVTLPGPHMVLSARPELVAAEVLRFIAEVGF